MSRHIRIPLRARDGSVRAYALVDAVDASLAKHRWYLVTTGYARRDIQIGGRRRYLYLHREILGLEPGDQRQADHLNRDRLDNRRANLRIVSHAENHQNRTARSGFTSRYRGVHWSKKARKWAAQGTLARHCYHIGHFDNEHEAGQAAADWRADHMSHTSEAL